MKGRCDTGSLVRVMKGSNVCMEVKRGLRNSIFLPKRHLNAYNYTKKPMFVLAVGSIGRHFLKFI